MKATVLLRIASVLTLIHAALHTIGGVFGKTPAGPGSVAKAAMQANAFQVFGATRTFWEFYRGLGLAVSIFLVAEGFVFWQLGTLARRGTAGLRPILWIFALAYLAMAVNSYLYFFSLPVIVEGLICACVAGAAVAHNSPA